MIAETNAMELLEKNLHRTEMLITAMEKIKGLNQIFQAKLADPEYYKMVKAIQDKELIEIEQSCGEHAIISLVTAFETYYKELTQQLLAQNPKHFVSRYTPFSDKVNDLIDSDKLLIYEDIERRLELKDRFGYYRFFVAYSIPFLLTKDEVFIEHLYLRRNNYVHNAGRPDKKYVEKLVRNPSPFKEEATSTQAKRLRTKLKKTLVKSFDRVIIAVKQV